MSLSRVVTAGATLLLALLAGGCDQAPQREPLPINTRLGGALTLTDQHGESFNTASLEGRVVFLFFGYTACPDICPATLARVTQVLKKLDQAGVGDQMQAVFITFDPANDTPEHIKKYLEFFHPRMIGLTGSLEDIRAAAERYGVVFIKDEDEAHPERVLYSHSDFIYLLDQAGRVRKLFPSNGDIEEMVSDAQSLL